MKDKHWTIALIIPAKNITRSANASALQQVMIGISLLALSLAFLLILSRQIIQPVTQLTEVANAIAGGNLDIKADITTNDETGVLAESFNQMTAELTSLQKNLEQRVEQRTEELFIKTSELEKQSTELKRLGNRFEKRARQFQGVAEVARTIASIQNLQELLPKITTFISDYFGYYHVGIFLIDEKREFAILRASNSLGGMKMLAREHKLKIGEVGIVGYATGTNSPRIALDTGEDATYFDNPDLPNTRSEMALPLLRSGQAIGALDIQSVEPNAFTNEDVEVFAVLADQVSIAIQNTLLYEETQKSLSEIDTIYRQYIKREWQDFNKQEKLFGYKFNNNIASPIFDKEKIEIKESQKSQINKIEVPLKLRTETIGSLDVKSADGHAWSDDEIEVIKAVAERVTIAAENARLLEQTASRAEREQLVSDITNKIRATNNPNEMLEIARAELQKALGANSLIIKKSDNKTDQA